MAVAAIDMSFMEDSDMFLKKETNAARPEAWSVLYLDVYWSFFFFRGQILSYYVPVFVQLRWSQQLDF